MILGIDHLGIAVDNLKSAIPIFRDLLKMEFIGTDEVPHQKVKVAMFKAGESKIELLESSDPSGPIAKFISSKGPGIHHISFAVDDIAGELQRLKSRGVRLINTEPVPGAHNTLVAFIHPSETTKVLVELCEHAKTQ